MNKISIKILSTVKRPCLVYLLTISAHLLLSAFLLLSEWYWFCRYRKCIMSRFWRLLLLSGLLFLVSKDLLHEILPSEHTVLTDLFALWWLENNTGCIDINRSRYINTSFDLLNTIVAIQIRKIRYILTLTH